MNDKEKGFSKVRKICGDRVQAARAQQEKGKKVIGYPCAFVPLEMLTALDIVPYRIYGCIKESITEADRALPAASCPIMRSILDCALKGHNDFLDGIAVIHSCDPQEKTVRVWESYAKSAFFHFIDMPSNVRPESVDYFHEQLKDFRKALEAFAGRDLSETNLKKAIELHNMQRKLVRELYDLTKLNPPVLTGAEIVQIVTAILSMPVAEGNELLGEVIEEAKSRKAALADHLPRLAIWTTTLDDDDLMRLIEEKAHVVLDDNCAGYRPFRGTVKSEGDLLGNLARYYLHGITCARTFKEAISGGTKKEYATDLEKRFGYFKDQLTDWKVTGVILFLVRYCDPFAFEMQELKDYLDSQRIPSTYIEYDYTEGGLAPIRTRLEAFVETIQRS